MQPQHRSNVNNTLAPNKDRPRRMQARHCIRKGLLAAILGAAGTVPLMAAPLQVPALMEPAGQEHHVGKVVFLELITPDLAASKQFYSGLLGWTFRDIQSDKVEYAQAFLDGHAIAGLVHRNIAAGEHRQSAWLSFMAVRDVDATEKLALEHGARVLSPPHSVPDRGREAVLADPQGAVFGVLASTSGDPDDVLAAPGEWIWSSLLTSDPDTDAAFYQTLFGYEVYNQSESDGALHLMFASDDYARASANTLPVPNAHPHWLNYVRVEDAGKMAEKAVSLGGRILVEPRIDRHGGRLAVVADPQGTPFGLLEWSNTESKEVTK